MFDYILGRLCFVHHGTFKLGLSEYSNKKKLGLPSELRSLPFFFFPLEFLFIELRHMFVTDFCIYA